MCRLLESIKFDNGELHNLSYHEARMEHAILKVFGKRKKFDLQSLIKIPKGIKGLNKCRIVYDSQIQEAEFTPYHRKKIKSIKLVVDETISYSHKFENRDCINRHTKNLSKGKDIIIIKKGMLRDASYSNIVLFNGEEWHTPTYPLLKGTKRAELLEKGIIKSKKLRPQDLKNYQRISFITAMNDLDELSMEL